MAYLEITGLPLDGVGGEFSSTVSLALEQGRGLSVLADDANVPLALARALTGRGPFSGEIILDGLRIDQLVPRDRPVRVLGETQGIIPNRSVRENMELATAAAVRSAGEAALLVERELTEGPLAGLGYSRAGALDHVCRTLLAATRILLSGCDLLLIARLPVPGGKHREEVRGWRPGFHLDALLDLKGILRRFRATWVSLLSDLACVHVLSDRLAVFSRGSLLQEGGLRECLNAPASRMVANFLAFPRVNYRTMRVERDGPFLMLRSGRYGFHVSEYIKRRLVSWEGADVVFGLRPEDLALRPYETGDPTVMNLARILSVDEVPGSMVVRVDMEGDEWVALMMPVRPFHTGQLVELRPDPDRVHIFHPSHGATLLD